MTPYEIDILLWYYTRPGEHPDRVRNPPGWRPTILRFTQEGLIDEGEIDPNLLGGERVYELTERGKVYIRALQAVPLPEQQWVMPAPYTVVPR